MGKALVARFYNNGRISRFPTSLIKASAPRYIPRRRRGFASSDKVSTKSVEAHPPRIGFYVRDEMVRLIKSPSFMRGNVKAAICLIQEGISRGSSKGPYLNDVYTEGGGG